MRLCAITKCKYDEIFELDVYAVNPSGRVRMILARQPFCFWHYSEVQLNKLTAGQFRKCPNRSFSDYVVKVFH
jgi:hypothetical protein